MLASLGVPALLLTSEDHLVALTVNVARDGQIGRPCDADLHATEADWHVCVVALEHRVHAWNEVAPTLEGTRNEALALLPAMRVPVLQVAHPAQLQEREVGATISLQALALASKLVIFLAGESALHVEWPPMYA